MFTAIITAIFIAALFALALLIKLHAPGTSKESPPLVYRYSSKAPLSESEKILYWRLKTALPEFEVLPQVAFSHFLEPQVPQTAAFSARQAIAEKSADFLIVTRDFGIVALVELDDSTHSKIKDQKRDDMVKTAGIKVVRWPVKDMPTQEQVRHAFTK